MFFLPHCPILLHIPLESVQYYHQKMGLQKKKRKKEKNKQTKKNTKNQKNQKQTNKQTKTTKNMGLLTTHKAKLRNRML